MPDCAAVGADGLVVPMEVSDCLPELPRVAIERVLGSLLELETDGVLVVMELPIREVSPELIRPLEFALPTWPPTMLPALLWLVLGTEGLERLGELEDGARMLGETGVREVADRLEFMLRKSAEGRLTAEFCELPKLRVDPNVFDLDGMDVLGLTVLLEMLRLDKLELLGVRTDRELILLVLRLVRPELAGARLTIEGALALGAGAGAGLATCRLAELLLPELELFRSVFAPNTELQSRIKTETSARIPILIRQTDGGLTSCRYSITNMICLLSTNDSEQIFCSNH